MGNINYKDNLETLATTPDILMFPPSRTHGILHTNMNNEKNPNKWTVYNNKYCNKVC